MMNSINEKELNLYSLQMRRDLTKLNLKVTNEKIMLGSFLKAVCSTTLILMTYIGLKTNFLVMLPFILLDSVNIKTIFKNVGSLRSSLEKRKALQVKLANEEDMLDKGFKDLEEALEKEKEVIRKINDNNSLY